MNNLLYLKFLPSQNCCPLTLPTSVSLIKNIKVLICVSIDTLGVFLWAEINVINTLKLKYHGNCTENEM